jgi:hypothetical protein
MERRGSLKGVLTPRTLATSTEHLDLALKSSTASLNLSVYTSGETSAKPSLSFVILSEFTSETIGFG